MSLISVTKLYDILSDKVGKEAAENLTNFIEQKISTELVNKADILATKKDIAEVRSEILATKKDIAEAKAETIKWMFVFWVGQVVATFGFILLFLKK